MVFSGPAYVESPSQSRTNGNVST